MSSQAIVSFLRSGERHVLVNRNGRLVKISLQALQSNFTNYLRGNIVFYDSDLPEIPHYSRNQILQKGYHIFACKITDYYRQSTEKQALLFLIQENYQL